MNYNEYIKIKNHFNIYEFYGKKFVNSNDMWSARSLVLLCAMCELESENKFPESSSLKDLIEFTNNNPEALRLKSYINFLPDFDESLGINQSPNTESQHGFITMNIPYIRITDDSDLEGKCDFKLDGKYKLNKDQTGIYLTVTFDDMTITLEKRNEFPEKTFRVNGTILENVEFYELVNIIAYANHVKALSKENIQAAHFLLS